MAIKVSKVLSADDTDVLAGTQLAQIATPGLFEVLAASSQQDTTITIYMEEEIIVNAQPVPLRTNSQPNANEDVPYSIETDGARPVISIDVVTAATVVVDVYFTPEDELDDD